MVISTNDWILTERISGTFSVVTLLVLVNGQFSLFRFNHGGPDHQSVASDNFDGWMLLDISSAELCSDLM